MSEYLPITLATYLHDIDPYAIKLWDGGPIRWYGLSYLAGFFIAYLLIKRVVTVGVSTLDPKRAADFVVAVCIGIVIGGRIGYVLFYKIELLTDFTDDLPFWGVLMINKGGMASHGGILGGILATWWYARRHKLSWPHLLDLMAFSAPIGLCLGRIANFINGELLGRPCNPNFPLAVKFPQEIFDWSHEDAVLLQPIVERARELLPRYAEHGTYELLPIIVDAVQSGNEQLATMLEPLLTARHPSQLYAAALEGLVVFIVLALSWIKPRRPLVIGGMFCATYAVVRIFDEFFREPDAHIGYEALGLTRGQWLSVLLLIAGIVQIVIFSRRNVQSMGGWRGVVQHDGG